VIAHKAMLASYGEGRHYVSAAHVRKAAHDTPSARTVLTAWLWGGVLVAVAMATMYWYFRS
jgi:MSHA biogenesis protein MshM